MAGRPPYSWHGLSTLVRLGLAAVWLIAGAVKVSDLGQNYAAVNAYEVLPISWVAPVSMAQPFLELALGVLLLVGLGSRPVAALSGVLLLLFIAGISQAWARGLAIDCGCFSGGGAVAANQTRYPLEIARDFGFLAMSVWLVVWPRSWASLDGFFRSGEVAGAPRLIWTGGSTA